MEKFEKFLSKFKKNMLKLSIFQAKNCFLRQKIVLRNVGNYEVCILIKNICQQMTYSWRAHRQKQTVENSLKLPYVYYKNKISITTGCVTFLRGRMGWRVSRETSI